GELQIPLLNEANSGLHSFIVSVSGRYDSYSDFGDTFNPKVGASLMPFEWFTIRGNWGTSFTAPTPLDQLGSLTNQISAFPFVAFTRPGDTPLPGSRTVAVQGSVPNLQPQTADTWSVGFDASPPVVKGLRASLAYYSVNFENILGTPTPNVGIFTDFPGNVTTNVAGLSAAQLTAFAALAPNGLSVINPLIASSAIVYQTVDFRTGNFGVLRVKGLDFSANYSLPIGVGSLDASVSGNYQLSRKQQASPTAAVADLLLFDNPKLFLQSTLGLTIDAFRASATLNHTGGFAIRPTTGVPVQNRVGSFNTVNLFLGYDLAAKSGLLQDVSLTVNVNNVFDTDPPLLFRNDQGDAGYANGFTIGRMFIFGVSKKF
ncbi:MAG: TonB-dependent receptor, partial [Parvularculaceae bacterium]|nr:TonB-dependent receptor [Parvularculaceae bacterium]